MPSVSMTSSIGELPSRVSFVEILDNIVKPVK